MTSALAVMEHASLWFGIVVLTQKWQFKHVPMKLKQKMQTFSWYLAICSALTVAS